MVDGVGAPSSSCGSVGSKISGSPMQTIYFQTLAPTDTSFTRYWFPYKEFSTFDYNSPPPGHNYTVTVSLTTYPANYFSGDNVYACQIHRKDGSLIEISSTIYNNASLLMSACPYDTANVTMEINIAGTPPTGGGSAPCNESTAESTYSAVPVTTPDLTNGNTGGKSGVTTYGTTYTQEVPDGYLIDTANDGSPLGGGLSITGPYYYNGNKNLGAATTISWSPDSTYSDLNNSGSFTLNYANYITQYPYDSHNTTVYYTEYYNEYDWAATGSPYWTCGSSSSDAHVSGPPSTPCANPSNYTEACDPSTDPACTNPCPSGGSLSGTTCTFPNIEAPIK